MASEAKVKGLVFKGTRDWIIQKYGEPGYSRFLDAIPEEDKLHWIDNPFFVSTMWPAYLFRNMCDALISLWGGPANPNIIVDVSGDVAIEHISTIFKVLMKIGSPTFVVRRFPNVYKQYFDTGELRLTEHSPTHFEAEITDGLEYGVGRCGAVCGWAKTSLKYSGAQNVVVEHPKCQFKSDNACIFDFRWDS